MNTLKESCFKKTNLLHIASDTARALYYYVQWTGHFVCKSDFYIRRANFNSYLLLYTLNGSGTLNYDGKTHKLGKNTLVLINCLKLHEYYPDGEGWEFRYIHFNGSLSKRLCEHISSIHTAPPVISTETIEKYFIRVYDMVQNSGAEEICSDMIYRILIKMIYAANAEKYEASSSVRMKNALYFISENYQKDIGVNSIADAAHMSRCHFSVAFKEHTGFSPHQYITNYSINVAKRFLHSTSKTIE